MSIANSRIDELRQRLAQVPPQSTGHVDRAALYRELFGFVPPCDAGSNVDSLERLLRGMHEQMRIGRLIPTGFDARTAQLILLAMMLMDHGAAAGAQGIAARRAGASWDDLRAVVSLAFLLHGLPAANRGDELLTAIAEWEHNDRIAGAVAAYG